MSSSKEEKETALEVKFDIHIQIKNGTVIQKEILFRIVFS